MVFWQTLGFCKADLIEFHGVGIVIRGPLMTYVWELQWQWIFFQIFVVLLVERSKHNMHHLLFWTKYPPSYFWSFVLGREEEAYLVLVHLSYEKGRRWWMDALSSFWAERVFCLG